jgi:hypothetical protein
MKPAGQNRTRRDIFCLARKDDKYRLRDFFCRVRLAGLPQRRRINESDVPLDERGERGFGIFRSLLREQFVVVRDVGRIRHSQINVRRCRD